MMILSPVLNADGALTRASRVNRYADHIVPTMRVIFSPTLALNRPIGPGPWTTARTAATVGGPVACRCCACGCGV
jgi:hypothetical protein